MTKATLDSNESAMWIMRNNSYATMRDDEQIYRYVDGVYVPFGNSYIGEQIEKRTSGDLVSNHFINEVAGHIKRRTYSDRAEFDSDPDIINVANGLYSMTTGMSPHSPKYLSLRRSPITYVPNATCPNIDAFIEDVVEPDRVQTMYEIGGYALSPNKNLKTAFIFNGHKNSGKSVAIKILQHLIGEKAITPVLPSTVSTTTYGAAEYHGKMLNLIDDLGNTSIMDTGVLKSVIGGGTIHAQYKYGQPFSYTPNVLCIFATNEVPKIVPFDEAFAGRFSIIDFLNTYEDDGADPDLIKKLITPSEMSGFFNKCMEALAGLRERNAFTNDVTVADRVVQYRYNSNPVSRYITEQCVLEDPEDYVLKDTLYRAYVSWAREKSMHTVSTMGAMTTQLKELGCGIQQVTTDDNERKRAYFGIRFNTSIEDYC